MSPGRACLAPAELRRLAEADPAAMPADAASHLVSCARCQDRLLTAGTGPRRPRARREIWQRAVVVVLGALVLVGLAFAFAQWMTRQGGAVIR